MSYDIYLKDPNTGQTILLEHPHNISGGTYAPGTKELWLNITYNYSNYYYQIFGDKGIRILYGKTGAETIPILRDAIIKLLKLERIEDKTGIKIDCELQGYWAPTAANARKALTGLLEFAEMKPDGIWDGD